MFGSEKYFIGSTWQFMRQLCMHSWRRPTSPSDEVSALLLKELGLSSVTRMGVRHAPGEVIGGEVEGEGARFRAKVGWDRAVSVQREAEQALGTCMEECR